MLRRLVCVCVRACVCACVCVQSLLGFVATCFSAMTEGEFEDHLQPIVAGIFTIDNKFRLRYKTKIKILLKRLFRRYG